MAKSSGLLEKLIFNGVDISGDVGSLSRIGSSSAVLDVTAIDKPAFERILAHTDGEINFNSFFNDATAQQHVTLKTPFGGGNDIATWLHGSALGGVSAAIVAKQVNYDPTRGTDGSLVMNTQLLGAANGLDFTTQLTAGLRTDTAATEGSSVDFAAASSLGAAAYLQVTAFSGTDVTMSVQSSSDNGAGDAFSNIAALVFTQVTSAPTAERKATSLGASIERYLRAVTVTTGGVTSVTFSLVVTRSLYAA